MSCKQYSGTSKRRGAVAVEFALVLPFLIATIVGLIEITRAYDVQNLLETGAREGARFASMDRSGMLQEGETSCNMLPARGLSKVLPQLKFLRKWMTHWPW